MSGPGRLTRRRFLRRAAASAAVAGAAATLPRVWCGAAETPGPAKSRVVVIRHDALAAEGQGPTPGRVREILDEAARALTGDAKAADAWARWLKPQDRLAVKVNCLGLPTRPAVALGLVEAVGGIGLAPEQTILWDRTNRDLKAAGYTLRARGGVRCFGTDALEARGNGGYSADVYTSGATGSLVSRIITDEATALVSAAVLKDHNLAGITGVMKNFFGAIHNPNKYHENGCDPFIADACAQKPIRDRLRLVICDATWPQYERGPPARRQWQWPYGGLILSTDPVAADRVGCEILLRKRAAVGMKPFDAVGRPVRHLASGEARGLGVAKLERIEVVSIGRPWLDVA
ncbi:MAG TPA: DUF362 domain-containing protein [Phycisphaerae bacterium]|nr:DUF362 domain-containing protein [Phycisphaerae bacterium]